MSAYTDLVARGCLCGTDRPQDCPIHEAGDNRGIAAFFKAGMPAAFPLEATCSACKSDGLLYPNVDIDDPDRSGGFKPTLVCPQCTSPAMERVLRADAVTFGHTLNDRMVFPIRAAA